MLQRFSLLVIVIFCVSCHQEQSVPRSDALLFKNPSSLQTGLRFKNSLQESDSLNILDYLYFYNGGGTAVGDINNDGLPDIYLSGNQVKNKLYLNKGNLIFEDISAQARVEGKSSWNTGAIMLDANEDGLLDIYVRAVVGINSFTGHDELFINNGDLTFTEQAKAYGLAYQSYGTTAALLDYDQDGDLDIYQLNHAVHTQESFGRADLRNKRDPKTGDRLLRNDNGVFVDVSEEAGVFGGVNGYGLGVAVSDFNQDGWPDLFVGNDFHEDDYYYVNLKDGRFRESLKENFSHSSRFSMGNDVADINHDGYPDILSLDMLPSEERVLKSSEGDDNMQTQKMRTERFGYHYQFTRNMLFVNQPGYQFKERALASGIASTDWSWSALFGDYNQDGNQDLFISNGIPKRPNNIDFINFISSDQIQNSFHKNRLLDQKALDLMPDGSVRNIIFEGGKEASFTDRSSTWISEKPSVSGASALADLDNDGDLDLVVNRINEEVLLYINQTDSTANWLKIKFDFTQKNSLGIGTKVYLYADGKMQFKELYTARGFQASSEPMAHFGLGSTKTVDSLLIIWPDQTREHIPQILANKTLALQPINNIPKIERTSNKKMAPLFSKVENNLGISYEHKEDAYLDFNRQKLIPYQASDRGPAVAVGDLNGDGLEDIYFGSSKFNTSEIYYGESNSFAKAELPILSSVAKREDVSAVIVDNKLFIGVGGADFSLANPALNNYQLTTTSKLELPSTPHNTSTIVTSDYDRDGDLDLFVGNHMITGDFGAIPPSYFLKNVNGTYRIDTKNKIGKIGMVTAAVWSDFTGDGLEDLIVVGEWMSPRFFENQNGKLLEKNLLLENLSGLWQAIVPFDIDQDGDLDYLLGNWGTNSKFKASIEKPLRMYYGDFDTNGQSETVLAVEKNGKYYTTQNLTGLASQLVYLKKKYKNNNDFAGKTVEDIFGKNLLKNTILHTATNLTSGYLKNNDGQFTFVAFNSDLQIAPIMNFVSHDFDGDGKLEVLTGGNYFGTKPYHGRLDSFSGALIKNETTIALGHNLGLDFAQKSIRDLSIITSGSKKYLLATFNNNKAQVYQIQSQR
ncbi:VCBS repeat-containing protein [Dokdonia sp. Hel_I_53]|uniref:VCBS repeat-containing protein n=1 Tax=Dokdonia sp. Hel_I_53 TaxID=1566287 RepID=UPI001199A63E|nr:VCBS repeat-containing protein [Dokdonia sp. Hel_I_53]TVZ52905.1 VCBS repeat protein [Dokdonia sp. Hel_I_53]